MTTCNLCIDLERYHSQVITSSKHDWCYRLRWRLCWAHGDKEAGGQDGPRAMQRLAHMIGFAFYDRTSHLCLHPKFGPWFSMRAVIVFEGVPFTGEAILPGP